jgi:transposase
MRTLIDTLAQRAITPVIPPKANRKAPRTCDFALYRERNRVDRFFNRL